jgi:hypothetical protein
VELRNRVLGHGLVRDPREDRADLGLWLPRLNEMLSGARFMADWELLETASPPRSWMGAEPGARSLRTGPDRLAAAARRPGEFLAVPPAGAPVSLYPFVTLLLCRACDREHRLFLYDSLNKYTAARKRVAMTENAGGHKEPFEEPARGLAERYAESLLLESRTPRAGRSWPS